MDELLWFLLGKSSGKGGGVAVTDITLNADGTYTVTDANADTHTLAVTETDGQITAITYDGNDVPLSFTSGLLTGVGDTDVDVSRYPESQGGNIGYQVKFKVDGDDYYVSSCQQGNDVTEPTKPDNANFTQWETEPLEKAEFPFTPAEDTTINAYLTPFNFLAKAGEIIAKIGGTTFYDLGGTNDIIAVGKFGVYSTPILLTTEQRSIYYGTSPTQSSGGAAEITTVTYNNVTYHVVSGLGIQNADITNEFYRYKFADVPDTVAGWQSAALEVLEAYFTYSVLPVMPVMQGNEYATTEGNITLTSSEVFGSGSQQALFQPYKAFDRKTGGTSDGDYFLEKNTQGFWCVKYPYNIKIKKLVFINTYSTDAQYYTRTIQFYADENMTIPIGEQTTANQVWQEITIYDNEQGITTDTIYMKTVNGRAGIGELRIYGEVINS